MSLSCWAFTRVLLGLICFCSFPTGIYFVHLFLRYHGATPPSRSVPTRVVVVVVVRGGGGSSVCLLSSMSALVLKSSSACRSVVRRCPFFVFGFVFETARCAVSCKGPPSNATNPQLAQALHEVWPVASPQLDRQCGMSFHNVTEVWLLLLLLKST